MCLPLNISPIGSGLCQKTCDNINNLDGSVQMFYAYLISCLIWVWGKGAAYDLTTQSAFKICLWNADAVKQKTCF